MIAESPKGLFELLAEHPEHMIMLDEFAALLNHQQARQILLVALDGEPEQHRTITFTTKKENRKIESGRAYQQPAGERKLRT